MTPPALTAARAAGLAIALASAGSAHAQAVERNLPPGPVQIPPTIVGPNVTPKGQDDTAIGPALRGVVLLGPDDPVPAAGAAGIDTRLVKRMDTASGAAVLKPFLGRPISRRSIAGMEAAIARYYRARGFPFVSLSTPPQELTDGVVRIRVVEFHAGRVRATGLTHTPEQDLIRRVRLTPGGAIDTERLGEDLRWLNRYPFRQTQAIFSPGAELGAADLDLASVEGKPWRIYGGYANSGSPSTGLGRSYLGAMVGLPHDIVGSYQFTASHDFWSDGFSAHPRYLSHGASLVIPTAARQALEITGDAIESNEALDPFAVRLKTADLNVGYRFALSNLVRLPGDLIVGAEGSRQARYVRFGDVLVAEGSISVYQGYLGWSGVSSDATGATQADVSVHLSPGGLSDSNTNVAFFDYTQGRMTDARYAYVDINAARTWRLPRRWALSSSVFARLATGALPDSQRIGLGGPTLVRGYTLDDGTFDSGVVWRNELRTPPLQLMGGRMQDVLSPYAFVDASYGWVVGGPGSGHPISAGVGADYHLGRWVDAGVTVAAAVVDASATNAGHVRAQAHITLSY